MTNHDRTIVIFRKFRDGDVIAIFPEIPATNTKNNQYHSYMHVGQHGACDLGIIRTTLPASPTDYAALQQELTARGYDLIIRKRVSYQMSKNRWQLQDELRHQISQ